MLDESVAPCSGEALPIGGSCGGFVSTCGTGEVEAGGAEEEWSGGGVEVLSPPGVEVPSCFLFLPRLKMPLKTRLTMLAASGAAEEGGGED